MKTTTLTAMRAIYKSDPARTRAVTGDQRTEGGGQADDPALPLSVLAEALREILSYRRTLCMCFRRGIWAGPMSRSRRNLR